MTALFILSRNFRRHRDNINTVIKFNMLKKEPVHLCSPPKKDKKPIFVCVKIHRNVNGPWVQSTQNNIIPTPFNRAC